MSTIKEAVTILEAKNLVKKYTGTYGELITVIKNISFDADLGETIIIMGPSGSGKSTLLNLLSGIEEPTEVQIIIDNINIVQVEEELRTKIRQSTIGMIFQFFELHSGLSCQETLELKLKIDRNFKLVSNLHFLETLRKLKLDDKADTVVDLLSRGEKQRLAIARAIVNEPKIILADEPTGALDSETAKEVMSLLRSLSKDMNSLLIVSTHDYNIINKADRLILLRDGEIISDKSAKYLFNNEKEN